MQKNLCDTHKVHDFDELKQRGMEHGHRWCNGWVTETSLDVFMPQEGIW